MSGDDAKVGFELLRRLGCPGHYAAVDRGRE